MAHYVLVAGSRGFEDMKTLERVIGDVIAPYTFFDEIVIVEGRAAGADTLAREYAKNRGLKWTEIKPNWKQYGRAAGPKRNDEMVRLVAEHEGEAVFFWDGESKGTAQCIKSARKSGLKVTIWNTAENRFMAGAEVQ